jgi:hypothetical protein
MAAGTRWTELLTCQNCGQSGSVHSCMPEEEAYGFCVEAILAAFKVVPTKYGEIFFCSACDQRTITS